MGDTNVENKNIALNETNNQYRQIDKNEQIKITRRPKPRPIPDVIPRFPNELLNLQGKGKSQGNGSMNINDGSRNNNSPNIGFTEQEKLFRANLPSNGSNPYLITIIPNTVPQNQIPRVSYVQSVSQNLRIVDPVYSQNPYGYRVPTVIRNPDNLYWNQPQFYRSKPGSVYGIPPEPRVVQNEYVRVDRRFNIVVQPNAIRVYNGINPNMQNNIPTSPSKVQVNTKTQESKDNIKVHIGGLLTLPRSVQTYSDESSQSSSSSSKDEESAKIALALPGMADFRKLAHLGCKDLEKIITQYNVKSSTIDLEEFCKTVRTNLACPKSGLIQMEPVMREIILAFLHISSSWVNLANLLPVSKDQPNPLDSSLEPLFKEFQQWQQVSKSMMEKITTALQTIPNEHERYISGAYKKQNDQPEILSKIAENWPTVKEWPKYQRQREIKSQAVPTTSKWNTQNHPMCYSYPNEIPLNKTPTNGHVNKDWETNFGSTIIYPQHYGKKRQEIKKYSQQENNYFRIPMEPAKSAQVLSIFSRPEVQYFIRVSVLSLATYISVRWLLKQIDPTNKQKKSAVKRAHEMLSKLGLSNLKDLNEYEMMIASHLVDPNDIKVTWNNIGGLHDIIQEIKEIVILPIVRKDLFHGSQLTQPPKGVLLHGPPGCGKTMIAKATAREAGTRFINLDLSILTDKWYGESQKLAAAVFSLAVKIQPCIIFIDEIDSFLRSRNVQDHEATAMMKAQFMTLWDGLSTDPTCTVIVMGATNRPHDLDLAIRRRMPATFHIKLPSVEQRKDILKLIMTGEPLADTVDLSKIAQASENFSGSDLKELCRSASMYRIRDYMKNCPGGSTQMANVKNKPKLSEDDEEFKDTLRPITMDDMMKSMKKIKETKVSCLTLNTD